ncbi:MAG: ribose 5-phosphate isomerase B [Firmicutes bacterium]|nr:ribose 5-phosphate isomerase B [Bacillota bacterium]
MKIALASDHAGYVLKEEVKRYLTEKNLDYQDFGTDCADIPVDYPDMALPVAEGVKNGEFDRGILLCGTGIGVAIAANKVPGIRAALCHDTFTARSCREHNDANLLVLGGRVVGPGLAIDIVDVWLKTGFAGGRHARRLAKIQEIERKYCGQ